MSRAPGSLCAKRRGPGPSLIVAESMSVVSPAQLVDYGRRGFWGFRVLGGLGFCQRWVSAAMQTDVEKGVIFQSSKGSPAQQPGDLWMATRGHDSLKHQASQGLYEKLKMQVKGIPIDDQTRCVHYHSKLDVVAIKFKCCAEYYPCIHCHEEAAGHTVQRWQSSEWNLKAILCGACRHELTINEYFHCNYKCPACDSAFNPACKNHDHLYFESRLKT
jgi:uncharacterized CHY-type Zn-finger protein